MAESSPTEQAAKRTQDVEHARARIRTAWRHAPDPAVGATLNRTGPVTGGDRSDPTLTATSARDHQRASAAAELARITIKLGQTITHKVDGKERPGSVDYLVRHVHQRQPGQYASARRVGIDHILALHQQWWNQLVKHVETLDTPTGFDEARALLINVNEHANALARTARWIHGILVRPPAEDDVRVCDHPECQAAIGPDDGNECDIHTDRRRRAEQRRKAEAKLDLTRPRCAQQIRRCDNRVSEADAARNRRNCAACRNAKSRANTERTTDGEAAITWHAPR